MRKYIKPFDTLRFIAAFLVVIFHWFRIDDYNEHINLGRIGVQIFFVLSGFLITSILLSDKEKNQSGRSLGSFFIKRTFRIFPLYYLVLFSFLFLPEISDHLGWFLAYSSNFLISFQAPDLPHTLHFWTLAVEEQFYIVWPFLMLLTPLRYIKNTIIGCVVLSIVLKIINWALFDSALTTLMPMQMVSIGAGGLLAYYTKYDMPKTDIFRKAWTIPFVVLFFIFAAYTVSPLADVAEDLMTSLFSVILIANLLTLPENTVLHRIMTIRPIMFLGVVSYGIYVYHMLIPSIAIMLHLFAIKHNLRIPGVGIILFPQFSNPMLTQAYHISLLLLISTLSWYLFEKPINKLGHYMAGKLKKDTSGEPKNPALQ